jgi:hypothetical protein
MRGERETRASVTMWRGNDPATLTAPDTGNILTATFRERIATSAFAKFGSDYDTGAEGLSDEEHAERQWRRDALLSDLGRIAAAFERGTDEETGQALRNFLLVKGPDRVERLLRYASEGSEFFHNDEEEAFATVNHNLHKETWSLRSRGFRRWLRYKFYSEEKTRLGGVHEPAPLRDQMIADAILQLEAKALFEGVEYDVHLRVGEDLNLDDGKLYLNLCDKKWRRVEIGPEGWYVIENHPTKFIRVKGMHPLPVPDKEGASLEPLRRLLNLQGEEGERNFILICS